jgi:hypothetical protein
MWFELYLLQEGLVGLSDLLEAVKLQQLRRTPLGQLALRARKMSMAQVLAVLRVQADTTKSFGSIAMEMGFLAEQDLALLLMRQTDQTPRTCDILVEMGKITRECLDKERRNFQRAMTESFDACVPDGVAR